jgi:hypothetical protein
MMISTRDLSGLPDILGFRRLTRALAMMDAILSPEWERRYYSFDSQWADDEMMASMRNGSGDHWFALLTSAGVALHGLAHEYPTFRENLPWPGIFDSLPREFRANFLKEPAFDTANSTFCIWRRASDVAWSCGAVQLPPGEDPDGSAWLLEILAGEPAQYAQFAAEYYDRAIDLADVAAVYRHTALTEALVKRLNPEVSLESLAGDMMEIGYPEAG